MDWKNKAEVLERVKQDGLLLRRASKELRNDPEVVLAAVENDGWALEFASKELLNNKEIVKTAVYYDGRPLKFASYSLRNDPEVVLTALHNYSISDVTFEYASDELKDNKKFVILAMQCKCNILKLVSDKLKDDKDVVIEQLKIYGNALKYASDRLKEDFDVVLEAVKSDGYAIRYGHKKFLNNLEIAREATISSNLLLGMAINPIHTLNGEINIFKYLGKELENNYELNLIAVTLYGPALRFIYDDYRYKREFIIAAIKNSPYSLNYAPKPIQDYVKRNCKNKRDKVELIEIINKYFDETENIKNKVEVASNPSQFGE